MFEERMFNRLMAVANRRGLSVGKLVRDAVRKAYFSDEKRELERREKAYRELRKWQKKMRVRGKIDYKALIEYGRER